MPHRGPGCRGCPGPCTHLSPRWPLLAAQGTSQFLEAVGQSTPSSRSRPLSRVELCGDSARQPGRRPQRPVRPPRLGRTPSGPHPDTAQRRRHPPPPRRAKGSAAGPRGDSYSAGKRTSGACLHPAHLDLRVTLKGSPGNLPPCNVPQPGCTCPHIPVSRKLKRRGWGHPGWLAQGAWPGLLWLT